MNSGGKSCVRAFWFKKSSRKIFSSNMVLRRLKKIRIFGQISSSYIFKISNYGNINSKKIVTKSTTIVLANLAVLFSLAISKNHRPKRCQWKLTSTIPQRAYANNITLGYSVPATGWPQRQNGTKIHRLRSAVLVHF